MWNILPSYQLYELTFSKNLDPLSDTVNGCPPLYEATSPLGSSAENDYFGNQNVHTNRWENSILGNTHRLTQLSSFNSALTDQLKIDVRLTSTPGKRGVKPTFYDGQDYEFLQGDLIHGHVTFFNASPQPVPFDMVSVVFEGRISVNGEDTDSSKKPVVFYKFLNMFDYRASWTPAYFDDSISESDLIDPVDGTSLMFPTERYIAPGVKYKKFFNFTIPDKLLECACEVHELDGHCQLLPSIGLDKEQFLQSLRKLREKPTKPQHASFSIGSSGVNETEGHAVKQKKLATKKFRVKDYSFPDTAISYCVEARVVGKLSDYGGSKSKDEYIMVKESSAPVRMIPKTLGSGVSELAVETYFQKFAQNVQQCIAMGRELEKGNDPQKLPRRDSVAKNRQLFQNLQGSSANFLPNSQVWEAFMPYKKKSLAQAPKVLGMLSASTPKRNYVLQYTPAVNCRSISAPAHNGSTKMKFPLTVTFTGLDQGKHTKPPEIKGLGAEIVACTIRSKKYPIPVELTSSLVIQNSQGDNGFEKNITQPFSRWVKEITALSEKFDPARFNLSGQNIMDIKSLANLGYKQNSLKIDDFSFRSSGGMGQWTEVKGSQGTFTKTFDVELDVKSLLSSEKCLLEDLLSQRVCLVPTFQSCIVCRFYFVTVCVKLAASEPLTLKMAVKIEN